MKQALVLAVILGVIACKYNTSYLFVKFENCKSCIFRKYFDYFDFLKNRISHAAESGS